MTYKEAIETIKMAKAEVEWEYPMDYQVAFDMAIEVLNGKILHDEVREKLFEMCLNDTSDYAFGFADGYSLAHEQMNEVNE